MNRRPVVFVTKTQHREGTVVPHQIGVHALGYGNLPRVVLTQAVGGVTLTQSDAVRLGVADDLPAVADEHRAYRFLVDRTLHHLRPRDRADPNLRGRIALQPARGRPGTPAGGFIEQVDYER